MAQRALGEVKPASTTVALRATNNLSGSEQTRLSCQAIWFQALSANTGVVYICDRASPTLTAHVHAVIPASSAGPPGSYPGWPAGRPGVSGGLTAADYWILPAVSGEGVRVSVIR